MKTYIIGRQEDCDIVINDPTQMVSRHHAVLAVNGSKMTITDQSSNGTYVNGIRIAAGAPVPVSRKDVVSFAQSAELNWARIPDPGRKTMFFILWAVIAVLALGIGGKVGYDRYKMGQENEIKKTQQDSTELANLKKVIDAMAKDYEIIKAQSDSLSKVYSEVMVLIDKKQASKELNNLIKEVALVETSLQGIKVEDFHERLIALKAESEYAKNPSLLEQKVKPVQELSENYKQMLKQVSEKLKAINEKLSNLPDKRNAPNPPSVRPPEDNRRYDVIIHENNLGV